MVHPSLDCFATLAMTEKCSKRIKPIAQLENFSVVVVIMVMRDKNKGFFLKNFRCDYIAAIFVIIKNQIAKAALNQKPAVPDTCDFHIGSALFLS